MDRLQSLGDVECEIVPLGDCRLEVCRGCENCFDRGEEFCALPDDRDTLLEKMAASDGVIFATPNYSFHVSALMKIFLDRLGFIFHRPRFFGKAFTSIVVQGIYGGDDIVNYLDFVGKGLGFTAVKGCCLTALQPMTEKDRKKIDRTIDTQSRKFYRMLIRKNYPSPGFFRLMVFRTSRTNIRLMLDDTYRDYTYYRDQGWFESDYYYHVTLNPIKKAFGAFFDLLAAVMNRSGEKPKG